MHCSVTGYRNPVPIALEKGSAVEEVEIRLGDLGEERSALQRTEVAAQQVERIGPLDQKAGGHVALAVDVQPNVDATEVRRVEAERDAAELIRREAEAAAITDPAERAEMLEGFGLGEGALFRMVRSAYHLLGLRTFFTTGEKETRAWTFYAGSSAPECAGRIHSDFQRGFIKAEVIHWDELLEIGSWTKAKELGKIRIEGKEYHPADGDVMEFRFNV